MSKATPTLRDVAKAANVSLATVSMALHNSPRISPETREKVHAAAKAIGYLPDPHISDLMGYLRKGRSKGDKETIAFVSKLSFQEIKHSILFHTQYDGALQRAVSLGYKVEFHQITSGMTESRLGAILKTRGIRGIIILPQVDPEGKSKGYEDFPWNDFASVAIGFSCPSPATHRVMPDQIQALHIALDAGRARGYKRLGLAIERWKDDRVRNHWSASYLSYQERNTSSRDRIPLLANAQDRAAVLRWYRKWKPDFIIGSDVETVVSYLKEEGFHAPKDFGYATLNKPLEGEWAFHSGIWEPSREVGAAAVDFLAGCLYRNEIGLPTHPQIILLPVVWVDGETAPPRHED